MCLLITLASSGGKVSVTSNQSLFKCGIKVKQLKNHPLNICMGIKCFKQGNMARFK